MVRKRVLLPLLNAAELLLVLGFMYFIVLPAFVVPCPEPGEEGGHGVSSPAPAPEPSTGSGGCEESGDCICLRVPLAVVLAVTAVVSAIAGCAGTNFYIWLVDGEEDEAAGAARKAGYVAIAGFDLEVAGGGGKNY